MPSGHCLGMHDAICNAKVEEGVQALLPILLVYAKYHGNSWQYLSDRESTYISKAQGPSSNH